MISEKNIKEMMDIYVKNGSVGTKELLSIGFNSTDITKLTHNLNGLERTGRGLYKVNFTELLKYANKEYEYNDDIDNSFSILYRCYLDDNNNLLVVYNLFFLSILAKKYDVTTECLDKLIESTSDLYTEKDINYYLYLLGICGILPEKYFNRVKYTNMEDIMVLTGDKDKDIPINKVRGNVINGKLTSINIPNVFDSIQERVEYSLISEAINIQKQEKDKLYNFAKDKKYNELIDYMNNSLSYRKFSSYEKYVYKLANVYLDLESSKKMPTLKSLNSNTIWEAIDNNNYRSALSLQKSYCEENDVSVKTSITYYILEDINEIIDEIIAENQEKEELKKLSSSKNIKPTVKFSTINKEEIPQTILDMLINGDIENACNLLKEYLSDNDYSYLVPYLIKISVYEEDKSFSKSMMAISMMKSGEFRFVLSEYILSFYEALGKKKFEIARAYLDILDKAQKLGHTNIIINGMRDVLNNAISESQDKLKRPSYDYSSNNKNKYSFEDLNIGHSYDEFKERGVILVDYNKISINNILPILMNLPYVDYFIIGEKSERKIVFRYKEIENINSQEFISDLVNNGSENYILGNYKNCLEIYKTLLRKTFTPNSSLYYRLGEICYKLNMKDLALDYFIISKGVNKIEEINVYNMLIGEKEEEIQKLEETKNSQNQEEVKREETISTQDKARNEEIFNYYGFDIDKVVDLILNSGLSLKDACDELGLWDEEYLKCALYIAREYYYLGDIKNGNVYLNLVTTRKKRSKFIEEFYNQVKMNKKFYSNGELEGPRLLLK